MQVLILVAVIVVLVVAHEFGHLIAAKLSGMRVDEFGIGYPPRALTLGTVGETAYTLNWIPFGGFVKIYGEDVAAAQKDARAFASQNRFKQAVVLVAGITMNLVLAYVLISVALIMGTPRVLEPGELPFARGVQLVAADVVPGSPAAGAGLVAGDTIVSAVTPLGAWQAVDPQSFTGFISASKGSPIRISLLRNGGAVSVTATPQQGLIETDPSRYALGVQVATVGVVPLSLTEALLQGAELTWEATRLTAIGLVQFFYSIFTFSANLAQVSGPVGIAGAVGGASAQGLGSLLSIMAIISINLALINLIPIPALDGGRLLFVIIESVIRRPIKPSVAQAVNSIGFVFLLLLMLVVTAHDIFKLVG
ncbi:MAG: M50 family metallopeptidase [Candidatus Paceibacterota bacterium]